MAAEILFLGVIFTIFLGVHLVIMAMARTAVQSTAGGAAVFTRCTAGSCPTTQLIRYLPNSGPTHNKLIEQACGATERTTRTATRHPQSPTDLPDRQHGTDEQRHNPKEK